MTSSSTQCGSRLPALTCRCLHLCLDWDDEGTQLAESWASWSKFGGFQTEDVSTTAWLWTLHADAHDFTSQATLNGLVASRLFATHFGHVSIVATWFSALWAGSFISSTEGFIVLGCSLSCDLPTAEVGCLLEAS